MEDELQVFLDLLLLDLLSIRIELILQLDKRLKLEIKLHFIEDLDTIAETLE